MKMKLAFALLALTTYGYAFAETPFALDVNSTAVTSDGDGDGHHDCPGNDRHCRPKTRDACFNLVCYYDHDKDHDGDIAEDRDHDKDHRFHHCTAALTFTKDVTREGGEVSDKNDRDEDRDRDDHGDRTNIAKFEVSCDGNIPQNNSGHRYTSLLGTRIQAIPGPVPAITLPRGALHTGPGDLAGNHTSTSTLEVDTGRKIQKLKGTCYIWTGQP